MAVAPANLGNNLLNPLCIIFFDSGLLGILLKSFSIGYISVNPMPPPNTSARTSYTAPTFSPLFLCSFIPLACSCIPDPPANVNPAYLAKESALSRLTGLNALLERKSVEANLGAPKVAKLPTPLPSLLVNKSPYFASNGLA